MNELKKNKITTLEISEISGKRHNAVLKAIRTMEPAWEKVSGSKFALAEYLDGKWENRPMYELSKKGV